MIPRYARSVPYQAYAQSRGVSVEERLELDYQFFGFKGVHLFYEWTRRRVKEYQALRGTVEVNYPLEDYETWLVCRAIDKDLESGSAPRVPGFAEVPPVCYRRITGMYEDLAFEICFSSGQLVDLVLVSAVQDGRNLLRVLEETLEETYGLIHDERVGGQPWIPGLDFSGYDVLLVRLRDRVLEKLYDLVNTGRLYRLPVPLGEIRTAWVFYPAPEVCDHKQCGQRAEWCRNTQFSGKHLFCNRHARLEPDFGTEDPSYYFWERVSSPGPKHEKLDEPPSPVEETNDCEKPEVK